MSVSDPLLKVLKGEQISTLILYNIYCSVADTFNSIININWELLLAAIDCITYRSLNWIAIVYTASYTAHNGIYIYIGMPMVIGIL